MYRHGLITINEVPTYLMYLSLLRYLPKLDLSQSQVAPLDFASIGKRSIIGRRSLGSGALVQMSNSRQSNLHPNLNTSRLMANSCKFHPLIVIS